MYQKEEQLDLAIISTDIANWSINHYGYFVKSSLDKLEMLEQFTNDLARLPQNSLRFVVQVQNDWIDEGHNRPPTIPEFLKRLRTLHNRDQENNKQIEYKPKSTDYAGMWDSASRNLDGALHYMKFVYNPREVSPATKWVIRDYFTKNNYTEKQLREMKL